MVEIRRLQPGDTFTNFSTGDSGADRHLRYYAHSLQFEHNLVATFVAIEDLVFTGYLAIAPSYLEKRDPSPRPTSVLRASRVAATSDRVHDELLRFAMFLTTRHRSPMSHGLVVDVPPERIARYEQLGFLLLDDVYEGRIHGGAQPMFLERATMNSLFPPV